MVDNGMVAVSVVLLVLMSVGESAAAVTPWLIGFSEDWKLVVD